LTTMPSLSPPPYVGWIAPGVTGKSGEVVMPLMYRWPRGSSAGGTPVLSSSPLPPKQEENSRRPRRLSYTMARSRAPALVAWKASPVVGKSVEAVGPATST
jgi:hypothetical protein